MTRGVVNVIGGGYAATEAALTLASYDVEVHLFDDKVLSAEEVAVHGKLEEQLQALGCEMLKENPQKRLHNSEKIKIFDKKVSVINLKEPTIIATGKDTSAELLKQLSSVLGEEHIFLTTGIFPKIKGKIEGYSNKNLLYVPVTEQQIKKATRFLSKFFNRSESLEKWARYGEDFMRMKVFRSALIDGKSIESAIRLRHDNDTFEIQSFQTAISEEDQKKLLKIFPQFDKTEFVSFGKVLPFTHIRPANCLNSSFQVKTHPNLFFAGSILGLDGKLEAIATGHLAALNLINFLDGRNLVCYPESSLKNAIDKIFSLSLIKYDQILHECVIMEEENGPQVVESFKKFKEDFDARISWHNNMCSKKRW